MVVVAIQSPVVQQQQPPQGWLFSLQVCLLVVARIPRHPAEARLTTDLPWRMTHLLQRIGDKKGLLEGPPRMTTPGEEEEEESRKL